MTTLLWLLASLGWPLAIIAYLAAERWHEVAERRARELDDWHEGYQARRLGEGT